LLRGKTLTEPERIDLLHQALQCYESARGTAKTPDEMASIKKNIGTTYWQMAKAVQHNATKHIQYCESAIIFFKDAQTEGTTAGKSKQWQNQLKGALSMVNKGIAQASSKTSLTPGGPETHRAGAAQDKTKSKYEMFMATPKILK
jgi:hypothetical protein